MYVYAVKPHLEPRDMNCVVGIERSIINIHTLFAVPV